MQAEFAQGTQELTIQGVDLSLPKISRTGTKPPILFLHGFGSTKEDYADIVRHPDFEGHGFLAYDAPGCGASHCADVEQINIPFLVETARQMLAAEGIDRFHLVGHSMGGLTSLMLADSHPDRVLSFCNIEGNIAPEDCFLSRQIVEHADPDPERFLKAFVERVRLSPAFSSALFAASLHHKVRAGAVRGIFSSMVDLSDHAGLMQRFLGLPCPKMFMYGEQNASLSYLEHIEINGVQRAEIPQCGHFPMYSNPPAMWAAIAGLISSV